MVSIIIPAYNDGEYLAETLDSVFAQTLQDWECIIVDDGSTDNTSAIAKEYCKKDSRYKYIPQENQGPSIARNNAIINSIGEYILPLDADDIIGSEYLQLASSYLSNHPEVKLVYCKACKIGLENGEWILPKYDYNSLLWENSIFCSALYRRKDYDKTKGYNPNMTYGLEDWDFWLTFLHSDDIVFQIDKVLFQYRIKNNSRNITHPDRTKEMFQQILLNHLDIYKPFLHELFICKSRDEELAQTTRELQSIKASNAYRLGKTLLKPFQYWKNKKQ